MFSPSRSVCLLCLSEARVAAAGLRVESSMNIPSASRSEGYPKECIQRFHGRGPSSYSATSLCCSASLGSKLTSTPMLTRKKSYLKILLSTVLFAKTKEKMVKHLILSLITQKLKSLTENVP